MTSSAMEGINGIGKRSIEKLFKRFKSMDGIKMATIGELTEEVGLSRARLIQEHFQQRRN